MRIFTQTAGRFFGLALLLYDNYGLIITVVTPGILGGAEVGSCDQSTMHMLNYLNCRVIMFTSCGESS